MPSAVTSLFSSPSVPSSGNTANVFQPSWTSGADTAYQNLIQSNIANNPYATYAPQAVSTFNQQYNNPYAPAFQTAANNAGTAFNTTGNADIANSAALTGAGNTDLTAANQVLNLGFDPQNALYNQQSQQSKDVAAANNAASGTGTSPYGTSVANQANTNFNIDWQNNQLQRAIQALSGYTGGVSNANAAFSGANTLGSEGASNLNNAGAVPFNAANTISGNQSSALNNLLQVLGNQGAGAYNQADLGALMQYMNLGANQSNVQAQNNMQAYLAQLQANQANASGFGSILGGGASAVSDILS